VCDEIKDQRGAGQLPVVSKKKERKRQITVISIKFEQACLFQVGYRDCARARQLTARRDERRIEQRKEDEFGDPERPGVYRIHAAKPANRTPSSFRAASSL
jgi:hypothetical protein